MKDYDKKILQQFARNVRKRRYELNLSQLKLAELMDVHLNAIGRIERQQANPSLTTIVKIAKALKVHPCDLLYNLNI